jgi:hypothetical protein
LRHKLAENLQFISLKKVSELNIVYPQVVLPQLVAIYNEAFLSLRDQFCELPLEKGIISIEKVQSHIESLGGLCELEKSFEDVGVVRVQNHREEFIRGDGFVFNKA